MISDAYADELRSLLTETIAKLDEMKERPARLLDVEQAARYLAVSPGTMRKWREAGKGPEYLRMDSMIRYSIDDLDAYVASHPRRREV